MNKVHDSNWNLSTNQRRKQRRRQRASSDGGGRNQTKSFSFFFFLLIFSLFFHSQQKKGEIPLSLSRHGCYRVIFFLHFFHKKKVSSFCFGWYPVSLREPFRSFFKNIYWVLLFFFNRGLIGLLFFFSSKADLVVLNLIFFLRTTGF